MKTTVWFTTSFIGFHRWPDAPALHAHLRETHRHKFNVRVEIVVEHDDRDEEFQFLKVQCDGFINMNLKARMSVEKGSSLSCEMIARDIHHLFTEIYPKDVHSVSVDEDGECGATLYS